jgi:hypothetical protein
MRAMLHASDGANKKDLTKPGTAKPPVRELPGRVAFSGRSPEMILARWLRTSPCVVAAYM